MVAVVLVVDLRRDAADDATVAAGKEELHVGVLEERVMLRREKLMLEAKERRHPVGVAAVEAPREANEVLEVAFRRNRSY